MPLHYPTDEDLPYLEWWRGEYDKVFVALHPFFVIPGLDPRDCAWETQIFVRSHAPWKTLHEITDEASRDRAGLVSFNDVEKLIPRRAKPVPWSSLQQATDHGDYAHLNRSLLTHISALKQEFADPQGAHRIEQYCAGERIFMPTEGSPQLLHLLKLAPLLASQEGKDVLVFDDALDGQVIPVAALTKAGRTHWRIIAAPDRSILVTTHWDSYFTLVCIRDGRDLPDCLEGFWADPTTTHLWWLER